MLHHHPHRDEAFADMRKEGIKLLVTIVNRDDVPKAKDALRQARHPHQLILLAKGTSGAAIMDIMGLDEMDKRAMLCVMPGFRAKAALQILSEQLRLAKPHRGIAFTMPLSGVSLRGRLPLDPARREQIQRHIEEGVDAKMSEINHDLILAVCPEGQAVQLAERARAAGATGATILSARQLGARDAVAALGLAFDAEREIITILAKRDQKPAIMDALSEALAGAHGLVFALPVDDVAGLAEG